MELCIRDPRIERIDYATDGAAAFDLRACSIITDGGPQEISNHILIEPGETIKIGTGIAIDLGSYECGHVDGGSAVLAALVLPRSGIGCKGLVPGNTPGLVDSDYLGQVIVCLTNRGPNVARVDAMERIAQLAIVPVFKPVFKVVEQFSRTTGRGAGGFGSTGGK